MRDRRGRKDGQRCVGILPNSAARCAAPHPSLVVPEAVREFIANRQPGATRTAATAYGFPFDYTSRPNWATYQSLLAFAERVRRDQEDLGPRDMIDLQSFIWVQGSDEY
jgi:hypothetical protein